jgi:hypothetical protein
MLHEGTDASHRGILNSLPLHTMFFRVYQRLIPIHVRDDNILMLRVQEIQKITKVRRIISFDDGE